jgi:hypothetical protein
MAIGQLGQLSQPGKLYGTERSSDELITFCGGLPMWMRTACSSAQPA